MISNVHQVYDDSSYSQRNKLCSKLHVFEVVYIFKALHSLVNGVDFILWEELGMK
jgi:hypothetical protein